MNTPHKIIFLNEIKWANAKYSITSPNDGFHNEQPLFTAYTDTVRLACETQLDHAGHVSPSEKIVEKHV